MLPHDERAPEGTCFKQVYSGEFLKQATLATAKSDKKKKSYCDLITTFQLFEVCFCLRSASKGKPSLIKCVRIQQRVVLRLRVNLLKNMCYSSPPPLVSCPEDIYEF